MYRTRWCSPWKRTLLKLAFLRHVVIKVKNPGRDYFMLQQLLLNVPAMKWLNPKHCIFWHFVSIVSISSSGLNDYLQLLYLCIFRLELLIYSSGFYSTRIELFALSFLVVVMLPWMSGDQVSSGVTNISVSSNKIVRSSTFFIMDHSIGVFYCNMVLIRWFLFYVN